ncbi:dTMP kinase [Gandjariella thermophila]|uniref:Thymidylate kinase n=2 Tax=Gandjariella thermophila TaxID=1931992 RepID=A0A4D4J2P8_9PSEU|nr:dTMP kinase [Gandjariella thermophila]
MDCILDGIGMTSEAGHGPAESDASSAHRIRSVLAIRPFRRLWGVTYLCTIGDWLSLLALTGLVAKLTSSYQAQSFAFSGVVLTQLLPGMLFAPLGGVLADRFDRRKVMVVCDLFRCGLFLSIAIVGSLPWLFAANFLVGCCALMWIPAKDSSVPNLLRRRDQVETANQLGLVMTYGIAVVSGAGLFSVISAIGPTLHLSNSGLGIANIIVIINGLLYLTSAIVVATRIPEISGRPTTHRARPVAGGLGLFGMFRDGLRYVAGNTLMRGLVIGMTGAFAAAGAVVGTARLYAASLLGGDTAFGMLFVAVFVGLGTGMAFAPKAAARLTHNRLFGVAIVAAGLSLVLVALAPHLWTALVTVALVGASAGVAFLTGLTIIGSQIEDRIRGRMVSLVQVLMKTIVFGSTAATPALVGLVQVHTVTVLGHQMRVDGTRPVLLGAGVVAALVGVIAYRQMGDRRKEPILADLFRALRRRPPRRAGLLVAVEGDTVEDTSAQARRLAEWLRGHGKKVLLASDPALDESRLHSVLAGASLSGARAHALVAAAVRADVVERRVRPALDAGELVIMERYVDSPLAHLGALGGLDQAELEHLADWATGRLRPDLTVLLDRDPATLPRSAVGQPGNPTPVEPPDSGDGQVAGGIGTLEHHWRVQKILTEVAAANPDRYVVVDADGAEEEVAERVRAAVYSVLAARIGLSESPAEQPVVTVDAP